MFMAGRILVVDDDMYLRELYQEILTQAGYEVAVAKDGQEGLQKMQEGGYHLVLLDMMMPKLDGMGVLNQLNENPPKNPNGKIVVLTNLTSDPVVQQALSVGASKILVKADLTPPQLLQEIKNLLGVTTPVTKQTTNEGHQPG